MIKKYIKKLILLNDKIRKMKLEEEELNIENIMSCLSKDKENYYTYARRPINVKNVNYRSPSYSSKEIAIVLQGQIIVKDHFTLQTVELYHRLYPESIIIVSTWDNENAEELALIKKIHNTHIVKSVYPSVSGHGHINYQRLNSMNGILKAKELGCKYVLKSRTDQRLYANNVILFFKELIEKYPLTINCNAKGRIAVCSLSTLKDRLYNICDMLLFGYIEDMLKYFSPAEAPEFIEGSLPDENIDPIGFAKARPGEIYFATHYIENCGFRLKWTFDDSDYYRNNLFIVFNSESVDQFWPKYGHKEYLWRSYISNPHEIVTFEDWFVHQENMESYDKKL